MAQLMKIVADEILMVRGGDALEDRVGIVEHWAWAIDGATGLVSERLFPGASDASWFVDALDLALRAEAAGATSTPANLLERVLMRVRAAVPDVDRLCSLSAERMPSAACAIVRMMETRVSYVIVGDCSLMFRRNGVPVRLTDPRPMATEAPILDEVKRLQSRGASLAERREVIMPLLVARRRSMNQPGGYCSLDLTGAGINTSLSGVVELPDDGKCVLCTDGFTRLVDVFGACSEARMVMDALDGPLWNVAAAVRKLEKDDPDRLRATRIKLFDDLAACRVSAFR